MSNDLLDIEAREVDTTHDAEGNPVWCSESTGDVFTLIASGNERGVWVETHGKGDAAEKFRLCEYLRVVAYRKSDQNKWAFEVEFYGRDGQKVRSNLDMADVLSGKVLESKLSGAGLLILRPSSGMNRGYLWDYLNIQRNDVKFIKTVSKGGWAGKTFSSFVFGNQAVSREGSDAFELADGGQAPALELSGTVEDWRREVCDRARHSTLLTFGLCLAFAAPLPLILGELPAIFHIQGRSGSGKTMLLRGEASVYGNPQDWLQSWNSTGNALEGLAQKFHCLPLLLDELGQASDAIARSAAYLYANAKGKARLNRDAKLREPSTNSGYMTSTGELGMAEQREQRNIGGMAEGEEVRFLPLTIPPDAPFGILDSIPKGYEDPGMFVDEFGKATFKYHGAPGALYIKSLEEDIAPKGAEEFVRQVNRMREEFVQAMEERPGVKPLNSQERRVLKSFSVVAVAGELASGYGITGWEKGYSCRICTDCFDRWRFSSESPEALDEEMVNRVLSLPNTRPSLFQKYWLNGEEVDRGGYPPNEIRGAVLMKRTVAEGDKGERVAIICRTEDLRKLCRAEGIGKNYEDTCRKLAKRQLLCTDNERRYTYRIKPGKFGFAGEKGSRPRVCVILNDANHREQVLDAITGGDK